MVIGVSLLVVSILIQSFVIRRMMRHIVKLHKDNNRLLKQISNLIKQIEDTEVAIRGDN